MSKQCRLWASHLQIVGDILIVVPIDNYCLTSVFFRINTRIITYVSCGKAKTRKLIDWILKFLSFPWVLGAWCLRWRFFRFPRAVTDISSATGSKILVFSFSSKSAHIYRAGYKKIQKSSRSKEIWGEFHSQFACGIVIGDYVACLLFVPSNDPTSQCEVRHSPCFSSFLKCRRKRNEMRCNTWIALSLHCRDCWPNVQRYRDCRVSCSRGPSHFVLAMAAFRFQYRCSSETNCFGLAQLLNLS